MLSYGDHISSVYSLNLGSLYVLSNTREQHAPSKGFDADLDTTESNQRTSRTELNGQQLR